MSKKIKRFMNNYGIFIIALLPCVVIYNFFYSNVAHLFESENIDKIFQSTITCTSIILGFTGTLITQLLITKREMDKNISGNNNVHENKFSWTFKDSNRKIITSTVLTGIISSMTLIFVSSVMLITDVLSTDIKIVFFCVWLYIIIIFAYYIISLYYLFISILFDNEESHGHILSGESEIDKQRCINAINDQNQL